MSQDREDDWKLPWSGGCRCARVRFRITQPPLLTSACHCGGCQRMTASAFSLTVTVPAAGFEVVQGEPVPGGLQADVQHQHCGFCKSWLFTRVPPQFGDFVNVRATMLDAPGWFVPFIETYTTQRLPWAATPARHRFEKAPEIETYAALLAEFVHYGARPPDLA